MRDILPIAAEWARAGRSFALATVVGVTGSAPREIGASMVVSADGEVFGSVSGGCVESAVYERSLEVVDSGIACVERFGYSDADAFAVGLTCGGVIDVLVRAVPVGSAPAADLVLLAERETRAVATAFTLVTSGPDLGRGWLDADPSDDADSVTVHVGTPARLIIVGAVEFAVALSRLAVAVGMRVSVVDPRSVFATAERFPGAEVVVAWPDRYLASQRLDGHTAVCVLSHDPKFDVPALCTALASPAGYVGAMGSRRTHEDRRRRLIQAGVPPTGLERLRSPIGLDLGGRTPEETALSILAEIIADRHGAGGGRLSARTGPVHAARPTADAAPPTADAAPMRPTEGTQSDAPRSPECAWTPECAPAPPSRP